jgi:hypothetical protein
VCRFAQQPVEGFAGCSHMFLETTVAYTSVKSIGAGVALVLQQAFWPQGGSGPEVGEDGTHGSAAN